MKNLNYNNLDISIIIPTFNYRNSFKKVFQKILEQTINPLEIIIIDSSSSNVIEKSLKQYQTDIRVIYKRISRAYPGKARNIGASLANGKILAFIDSKTVPEINWLEKSLYIFNEQKLDVVFGKTKFFAKNKSQELYKLSIYGNSGHETVPGSLIKKATFNDSNEFINNVRTAEDISWRNNLKEQGQKYYLPEKSNVFYYDIPSSFIVLLLRYFIYSFNTIKINAQDSSKDFYLSILIILISILIPKWNELIVYLSYDILQISYLTRNIILSIFIVYLINIIAKYCFLNFFDKTFSNLVFKFIILISSIFCIFKWNFIIIETIVDLINYLPHLTKIFLLIILIFGLFYRGIILPLYREVSLNALFPLHWMFIGSIGVLFDIMKAPAYFLGGIYSVKNIFIYKTFFKYQKDKKILVICPYPKGEQAGQRLKYEQQFSNFEELGFEVVVEPFMDKDMWTILYKKGFFIKKVIGTLKGYFRRFTLIFQLYKYEIVYIFLWATPFEDYVFERLFIFFSKKIVYDIEDNVLIMEKNEINPITYYLKSKNKITYLIKNSTRIITSSKKLIEICNEISKKNNSVYIPPGIDILRYSDSIQYSNAKTITIGWTGTFTSKRYLDEVIPILIKLSKIRKIKLLVISNFEYNVPNLDVEVIPWTKDREIHDLLKMDIGIYPLIDEKWVAGKSGLKALQYMALGIPTIASNIGNSQEVIKHMKDGILVNNEDEWLNAFLLLIDNIDLRKKLGQQSREKVFQEYTIEKVSKEYNKILLFN